MTGAQTARAVLDQVRGHLLAGATPEPAFEAGVSDISTGPTVLAEHERLALMDAALDLALDLGRTRSRKAELESELARLVGVRRAALVTSSAGATLLAVTALTSPRLGERRLRPGDEVLTAAVGLPTTVNAILANGLVPVLVDVDLTTYTPTPDRVRAALGPRTRAIVLRHVLGNPFPAAEMAEIAAEHGLWLIEEAPDALGSRYRGFPAGSFGHLSTLSPQPDHPDGGGGGSCVAARADQLAAIVTSLRDGGRDCCCGADVTDAAPCRDRAATWPGALQGGCAHDGSYSHLGYDLGAGELDAAVGLVRLRGLAEAGAARRAVFASLREGLDGATHLILPEATPGSDPNWSGFAVTVRRGAPFTRNQLVSALASRRIATRPLLGGNVLRQPACDGIPCRVPGSLANAELVTDATFWLGVHPGITDDMIDYVVTVLAATSSGAVARRIASLPDPTGAAAPMAIPA